MSRMMNRCVKDNDHGIKLQCFNRKTRQKILLELTSNSTVNDLQNQIVQTFSIPSARQCFFTAEIPSRPFRISHQSQLLRELNIRPNDTIVVEEGKDDINLPFTGSELSQPGSSMNQKDLDKPIPAPLPAYQEQLIGGDGRYESKEIDKPSKAVSRTWNCKKCTFRNVNSFSKTCSACGHLITLEKKKRSRRAPIEPIQDIQHLFQS